MTGLEMKPRLGWSPVAAKKGRLLFICYYDPNFIATVVENIGMWQRLSSYDLLILNMWPNRNAFLTLPPTLDLADFDGVIVHSTASYFFENLKSLDSRLRRRFAEYDGVKVLMKQDEQVKPGFVARYLGENRFDLLVTCVPPNEVRKVYPVDLVGELEFLHAYTGYISPAQRALWDQYRNAKRTIDVSYRGSMQPLQFGRLGFEKRKIGYDVAALTHNNALTVDISSREEDRIGGPAWFDFLGSSNTVLGVESGSNLFDYDGEVEAWCKDYVATTKDLDPSSEAYYQRAHRQRLHELEGNVEYAQISPRHLEAACAGAVQVLYEGEYSGRLKANEHFFPLKRDLSNWDEALDLIRDPKAREQMAERSFHDIVTNPELQYDHFVQAFDAAIDKAFAKKTPTRRLGRSTFGTPARPRILIMASHDPVQDPRLDWWAAQLAKHADVCELGTHHTSTVGEEPTYKRLSPSRLQVRVERARHDWAWPSADDIAQPDPGVAALLSLRALEKMPKRSLWRVLGAYSSDENQLKRFEEYCTYFINTNSALLEAGLNLGAFDMVLCCDVDTLPAAVSLSKRWNVDLFYDAHEFWPYAFLNFEAWESHYWAALEASLAPYATRRATVSPPLADIMSREYGVPFEAVPNCAPLGDGDGVDTTGKADALRTKPVVDFLFQGAFAAGRGLHHLIQAWANVKAPARLLLRGRDGEYKRYCVDLADSLGLLNKSVFFPEPVSEDELIATSAESDVGVVPYEPLNVNYRNASPNKLSQYMAAGLPILTNNITFVSEVVSKSGAGRVADFSDHDLLARTIDEMVADRVALVEQSKASARYFREHFHFEAVSKDAVDWMARRLRERASMPRGKVDLDWIRHADLMRRWAHVDDPYPPSPPPPELEPQLELQPDVAAVEERELGALETTEPPVIEGPAPPSEPIAPVEDPVPRRRGSLGGFARRVIEHPRARQLGRMGFAIMPTGFSQRLKAFIVRWLRKQRKHA